MLNPKKPYLNLEKEKENFCVLFTYFIKRAREIRKFHVTVDVTVVQRRHRNVQKSVIEVQNNALFFCLFVAVAVVVAKAPYCS